MLHSNILISIKKWYLNKYGVMKKKQKKMLVESALVVFLIGIGLILRSNSNSQFICELRAKDLKGDMDHDGVYKICSYVGVKSEVVNTGGMKDTTEMMQMGQWLLQGTKTLTSNVVFDSISGKELKRKEEYKIKNYELISLKDSMAYYFTVENQKPVPKDIYSIKNGNRGLSIFIRESDKSKTKPYKILEKNKSVIALCGNTSREGYLLQDTLCIDTSMTLAPFQTTAMAEGRKISGLLSVLKSTETQGKQQVYFSVVVNFKKGLDKSQVDLFNKLIGLSQKKSLFRILDV